MTSAELLAEWRPEIRQVPSVATTNTCSTCLGPTSGYPTCFPCGRKWAFHPEFAGACDLIVPATVAVQPSKWYSAVWHYKTGDVNFRSFAPVLAAVCREWLQEHAGRVADAMSGSPDLVTVVPSRNSPPPTRLARVVSWAIRNAPAMGDTPLEPAAVAFTGERPSKHKHLFPESLKAAPAVAGQRILLVEDTWVSGSTALSTAIALRRAGALGVSLVSIARMVYEDSMTPDYENAAVAPIEFSHWPR